MYDLPSQPPAAIVLNVPLKTLAQIIKIPPKKQEDVPYNQLTCSETDIACVTEIITTLGENGKLTLLFKQGHLKQLGSQINHLHPLKFLSSIFCNPDMKVHMVEIFDDYFKRTGFMDGLGPSLDKEAEKGKLNQYLSDFANEICVPLEEIQMFFQAGNDHDWEAFVYRLIELV